MHRLTGPRLVPAAIAAALGLSVCGCRDETVSHARVPKVAAVPAAVAGMTESGEALPEPPRPPAGQALAWTLPAGWSADKGQGGMRYATLKPPGAAGVELTIVVLPGSAGGELANVNRWRAQVGLAEVDDAGLAAERKAYATAAGPVGAWDLAGQGEGAARMLAAILTSADGNTWFVKLTGPTTTVAPLANDFAAIVRSLRFE